MMESLAQDAWMQEAACRAYPDSNWFEPYESHGEIAELIRICQSCPVLTQCRKWTERMEHGLKSKQFGVYGGETALQRSARRQGSLLSKEKGSYPFGFQCSRCGIPMVNQSVKILPKGYAHRGAKSWCVPCEESERAAQHKKQTRMLRKSLSPCLLCGRAMRPRDQKEENFPGTIGEATSGVCYSCYRTKKKERRWEIYAHAEKIGVDHIHCVVCRQFLRPRGEQVKQWNGRICELYGYCKFCFEQDREKVAELKRKKK